MTNKLIACTLLASMVPSIAFSNCDYTKIIDNGNGTYTYSKELHICVGKMKQDLDVANQQVAKFSAAASLKDIALSKSDERADRWRTTSLDMEDKLVSYDKLKQSNEILYFVAGVLVTGLAVWGAGQLRK